jgi:hypothetical protein
MSCPTVALQKEVPYGVSPQIWPSPFLIGLHSLCWKRSFTSHAFSTIGAKDEKTTNDKVPVCIFDYDRKSIRGGVFMKELRFLHLILALCTLLILPSCGGGGGDRGGVGGAQSGNLALGLTDATTDDYKAVYVTISEVQVHMAGETWKVVGAPNKTYNLLELVNGVREELGVTELDAGDYTQMRLIIGKTPDNGINILSNQHPYANYVIDLNDEVHELKVPSGYRTGVKIVQGFTIDPNQTTELILDFNASQSVVKAGKSGNWLLKPTIKVLNTQEYSIISGTVYDDSGQPLFGVLVSAQINDPSAPDLKDQVVTETSTGTDDNGQYTLFIEPGTYNIVVYTTGYDPKVECSLTLASGDVAEDHDFTLSLAQTTGTVFGDVSVTGGQPDQYATLSFRQSIDCNSDGTDDTEIEVESLNVVNGGSYTLILPVGLYDLVASSYGEVTQSFQVDVVETPNTEASLTW